jgi:hypothetical protein
MEGTSNAYRISVSNLLEGNHLEDYKEDERITLKCILGR